MATRQAPIGSGFGAATTTAEVIRGAHLEGKTVVVTGGSSGLGLETTRTMASAGARVVVPARSREKAASALQNMKNVELESLELSDPSSVNAFADRFLSSERPLHVLVDGAGIMAAPLQRDQRGYESHLSTNHLGHFQWTLRLLPALRRARGARVVTVSSWAHRFSPFHFEDPNFELRTYERWAGYGQSKTKAVEAVRDLLPGGADHVFDFVGVKAASESGLEMLGVGGGLYLVGLARPDIDIALNVMSAIAGQTRVQGVNYGSTNFKRDIPMYAELYLQGRMNLDDLVSKKISLREVNDGYAALEDGSLTRVVVTSFEL